MSLDIRKLFTQTGCRLLCKLESEADKVQEVVTETIRTRRLKIVIHVAPVMERETATELNTTEEEVLQVCTARPKTAKSIANSLGRKLNSYLRATLTGMVRKNILVKSASGYAIPGPAPS